MSNRLKIEGLYDSRTLKFLKGLGISRFSFDFNPRSFNFIQEHVFLEQLIPLLGGKDEVTLTFTRSNDPMLNKVLADLKRNGFNLNNVRIDCLEWSTSPLELNLSYYLNYNPKLEVALTKSGNFKGFIFDYS